MRTARFLLWGWLAIALGFLVLINTLATGIADWLLEWQFDTVGSFRPTVTLLGMFLLAAIPAVLIFGLYWRRRVRDHRTGFVVPNAEVFAERQVKVLSIVAAVAGVCAVVSLLLLLTLPSFTGKVMPMPNSVRSMVAPIGPARVDRLATNGPQVRFSTRLLWRTQIVRFVPVSPLSGEGTRIFVQLDDSGLVPASVSGVSARNALPPSVRNLFLAKGLLAPGPYYVLFSQPNYLRQPYLLAALQFGITGLLFLAAMLLQRRNLKRARDDRREHAARLAEA